MVKYNQKCGVYSTSDVEERHITSQSLNNTSVNLKKTNFQVFEEIEYETGLDLNNIETPILDALENYSNNPSIPLHIPGHARGEGVFPKFRDIIGSKIINIDTTDEFDNLGTLHPATGPIKKSQELTAQAFGAKNSFFLINGSSVGNLALALTVTKENQKIIVARNCHRSVISGLTMTGAIPIWVTPEWKDEWEIWGTINPAEIEHLLNENPDATTVWITNPTYEGIVSNIKKIAAICKKRNITLLVDEAHGCLWNFHEKLPQPALNCGADAVVHSIHKTGGSFSQSSVLHIGKESKICEEELEANLKILQSTSPSYLLLASLDSARAYLSSEYGLKKVDAAVENAILLRKWLNSLPRVECLEPEGQNIAVDHTKIFLKIDGLSGKRLESILEIEYHIEVEAAADNGILVLVNIGNTKSELEYFWECMHSIVSSNYSDISYLNKTKYMPYYVPEMVYSPRKAFMSAKEKISTEDSIGRISAEVIAECPPGIPILMPGEKITEEHLPYIRRLKTINVIK